MAVRHGPGRWITGHVDRVHGLAATPPYGLSCVAGAARPSTDLTCRAGRNRAKTARSRGPSFRAVDRHWGANAARSHDRGHRSILCRP